MEIILNGSAHTLANATSVAELLTTLGYAGKRVAVERNGRIVPRSDHERTVLVEQDRIEIVVAVGGG